MTQDTIPGITITLTENPLQSKVTMTESARREFVLRFALKQMEDIAWEVKFRNDEQSSSFKPERAADAVTTFTEFEGHDVYPENSFSFWEAFGKKNHLDSYIHALNEEHGGDCTAVACSCIRCWAESLAGIDTCPGGKHMNARIAALFAAPITDPKLVAYQAERKQKSDEYWEKFKQEKPQEWEAIQVRWAKERADLDEYMRKHRQLLAEQNARMGEASSAC